MKIRILLFILLSFIYIQSISGQKPKLGYSLVEDSYALISSSKCTVGLSVSFENGAYDTVAVQDITTQEMTDSLQDGYRVFLLNFLVPLGEADIDLVLQTTDTFETYTYPKVGQYNCTMAPTLVADTFNYTQILPVFETKIPLRLVGYNRMTTLQIVVNTAQSPYTIRGLVQDPVDFSLFYISAFLNPDNAIFAKSIQLTITETSNPSNTLTLDYEISFEDYQSSIVMTPLIYPNPDRLSPIKTLTFSLLNFVGDVKNGYIRSNPQTLGSLNLNSYMAPIKGNDQNCTMMLISKVSSISKDTVQTINIYGYPDYFLDAFNIIWPSRPPNVFSNPDFTLIKSGLPLPNLGEITWTYTFDPIYYPFSPTFSNFYNDGNNEYPFGIASGNLNVFQTKITEYFESYLPNLSQYLVDMDAASLLSLNLQNTQIDSTPPVVHNITFTKVPGSPDYHVRVNVTDDLSGFYKIQFGEMDSEMVYYFNSIGNDIYEGVVKKTYRVFNVFDKAGNLKRYDLYLPNGVALPTQYGFTANMITTYTKELLDMTTIFSNPPLYDYDPELKMYKIDFYMEQGLYAQNISYIFGQFDNSYSNEQLIPILGSRAVLTIVNNDANQMPPIISSISQFPAIVNLINNPLETLDIGWTIEIDTQSRFLAFAQFNVTS
ncbi:hypothetical protein CYY_010506, partial [Polysphondylium violaceum]